MKQTFEIPEGCNRVTIEQQGRQIITTFEPEFKDGDFIFLTNNNGRGYVAIFKKTKDRIYYHVLLDFYGELVFNDSASKSWRCVRHATEEEKQKLFDAMAKDGKRWNDEEKRVEDIKPKRWRSKYGCDYWFIGTSMKTMCEADLLSYPDNSRYNSGNYFKTEEQAESAAEKIKELLKQINT